jgi:hypothetical protein
MLGPHRRVAPKVSFVQLGGDGALQRMFGAVLLLVIRYGWNDYIANRVEPWMHVVAIGFPLSTGVAGLALDL